MPENDNDRDRDLLILSTAVSGPAGRFQIDGVPYEIYGTSHLTPAQEAESTALFAQNMRTVGLLARAKNQTNGEALAARMRQISIRIIELMTNAPKEVIEKLPAPERLKLVRVISDISEKETADPSQITASGGELDLDEIERGILEEEAEDATV